ncbi:MAG: hypothetical protein ACO4CS_12260 [bacterium]
MIPLLCPCENQIKELKKILTFFASGQQGFYIDQCMAQIQKCIVNFEIHDKFQSFSQNCRVLDLVFFREIYPSR